jgi:hypothetical protein
VSTAVLGTAEIVGPGRGAVAVPEEVEAFAGAVIALLRQPSKRQALGREAREYVAECWSSAAMARRLITIYEDVASARGATRDPQRATRVQFAAATSAPSSTNQTSTHAGMLSPRNDQLTSAHSPEPVKTMRTASNSGNASSM